MEQINYNNTTIKNKQPSTGKKIGAVVAGLAINGAAKQGVGLVSEGVLLPNMQKIGKSLSEEEYAQIKDAIKNITTKANLAKNGVDIITVNSENAKQIEEMVKDSLSKKMKFIPKEKFSISANILTDMVKDGKNAFFENGANKIFIGDSKELAASVFHEAGHAMNYNLNKFTKLLQNCRNLKLLAIPIALISLIHTDKTNENGEQSKLNKAGGFVKKHAAGLTLLSFLPMVAEEGLASGETNA